MASLPLAPEPAIYAGYFNCQHTDWGHSHTTPNGETLSQWASSANALLPPPSFFSARWNTHINPDLAFAVCHTAQKPEGHVLDRLPRSHHQLSIIKVPSFDRQTVCHSPRRQKEHHHASRTQTTATWMPGMQPTAEYS